MHARHRDRDHHWQRSFSQTTPTQAAEDPDSLLAQLQASPLIQKIADKPDALKALQDFATLLKESGEFCVFCLLVAEIQYLFIHFYFFSHRGVELQPGRPPSTMQMFRLASDQKFREGAKRVVEELKKAGVDLNSENAMELFGMKKPPGP
ncbi:uncharacterized protein FOMMEDRAFT_29955 [Fomitiporia mediterranea MF3/22]|uniref:uncharacterized protein n=1 Tax=Fomitiporia mediterranea (strain MF3/22) TaxID=694068 RepID=UPI0004409546|nr:uncharacterized protein FOMMEDRAFT_29955 [Fomitiporia mediterranea MF3/22]EJD01216.1 hypothetical protein FOMMEDRAFT_29955 [Fomitiporia mediterranea MF3/22]